VITVGQVVGLNIEASIEKDDLLSEWAVVIMQGCIAAAHVQPPHLKFSPSDDASKCTPTVIALFNSIESENMTV
jgi:hypothetical protein